MGIYRPDGNLTWISINAIPVELEGRFAGAVVTAADITDRKHLESELRATIEQRDDFISIASHELRSPLTALILQLNLLESWSLDSKPMDPRIRGVVREAARSARSLAGLLDELLDITQIRAGMLTLNPVRFNLRDLLDSALRGASEGIKDSLALLRLHASEDVLGEWDPVRIQQVIVNLLSNAVKYGEDKPIDIYLSLSKDGKRARLSFKDSGIGISKEMQKHVFDRFFRAQGAQRQAGLGLGLFVSQKIIEAHGGTIAVESEPGKGSCFTVELPLRSSSKAA